MKLLDLETIIACEQLEIIVDNPKQFTSKSFLRLRSTDDSTAVYLSTLQNDNTGAIVLRDVDAEFSTVHYSELWRQIQNTNYLAQVVSIYKGRLTVFVIYGFVSKKFTEPIEIAVTDKQTKNFNRNALRNANEVRRHILEDYVLEIDGKKYICVAKYLDNTNDSFIIVNGEHAYDVKQYSRRELGMSSTPNTSSENESDVDWDNEEAGDSKKPEDMIWAINQGERTFSNNSTYSLELWECSLKLRDETTVGRQRASTTAFIQGGLEKYLAVWQQYTEIDYEIIRKLSERAGRLEYSRVQHVAGTNKYQLTLSNPQILDEFLSCMKEFGKDTPKVDVTIIGKNKWGDDIDSTALADFKYRPENGNVIEVELDKPPKIGGHVTISTVAANAQRKRREKALERILSAKSAKPDLAMLISGEMANTKNSNIIGSKKHINPFSAAVLECFHGYQPTEAQTAAVSIALNTPDFAIIQGPPGTGKSTVISAIMTALTEKEKDPELAYGKNLLTAYQRDATSNLSSKLRVYGLPVPTYKGYSSDKDAQDAAMIDWIKDKGHELDLKNKDIKDLEPSDRLMDQISLLIFHFNERKATIAEGHAVLEALSYAINECITAEKENYRNRVQEVIQTTEEMLDNGTAPSLRAPLSLAVYQDETSKLLQLANYSFNKEAHATDRWYAQRLPDCEEAMSDNGSEVVSEILNRFSAKVYSEKVQKIAAALRDLYNTVPIPFRRIQTYKDLLIVNVDDSRYPIVDKLFNQRIMTLLEGISAYLETHNINDEQKILTDYHHAFDSDNEDILKEWLSEFMTVIAATHQRSVSNVVSVHKGIISGDSFDEEDEKYIDYENVLIDEAARSCPPDLLIPMSCAKQRIILVGDQNQLPQFISDTVYEKLDGYTKSELDELVREPLFKRLIKQVEKLEAKDHVQRFVRLNDQYRMPKTLGDIISKYFYENEKEQILQERVIKSPLGNDDNHTADLPLIAGKHLVWIDVPSGKQQFSESKSLYRLSEVEAVVKLLRYMLQNAEEPEKYTYGIITFYREQRDRIATAISQDEFLKNFKKFNIRIRVGTVDAFQGLEDDIVILSMVRSLTPYDDEKNIYGFTSNSNRQCVALSRAKRCLIIVGDKEMVSGKRLEEARKQMPAIAAIYETCSKGGVSDACVFKTGNFTGSSAK